MAQTVLLLWFFAASLLFNSLVILLLMPSKYKHRSNCPAPKGILKGKKKDKKKVELCRHLL